MGPKTYNSYCDALFAHVTAESLETQLVEQIKQYRCLQDNMHTDPHLVAEDTYTALCGYTPYKPDGSFIQKHGRWVGEVTPQIGKGTLCCKCLQKLKDLQEVTEH